METEAQLLRRAAGGDERAFRALVEPELARLYTLAARVLGSGDEAQDAVQDALLRAWRALPRFRGEASFGTWLYRIVLNAARDRAARPRTVALDGADEPADPRSALEASELAGDLQRALGALDEEYRVAVVLYDVLGVPYAEAAELLGVPEGTVKSRIYRGRRALAQALGTSGGDAESESR